MNKSLMYKVFVAAAAVCMLASAEAQERKMYSWTDENGTVHFSETRPPDQDVKEQSIPEGAPQSGDNPYAGADTGPSYAQQRREEIARANEVAQVDKAITDTKCSAWRSEVARLEPNRRVFYTDEQGETVRMDDVERTNRVAQLKSQIAKDCN